MNRNLTPPPLFRASALSLLLALPVSGFASDFPWRALSQLPVHIEALPVFADLDGDSTDEIIFGTQNQDTPTGPFSYALSVIGQGQSGGLERIQSVQLPQTLFSLARVRRAGSADSVIVTVGLAGATRLMEFTGRDLRLVREVIVPDRTRVQSVADVNTDGLLDLIGDTSASSAIGFPQVLAYATAAVQWTAPDSTAGVVAAQLDSDPALEIISRGSVGRVYDGGTGLEEWAWPSGFGRSVVAGRFEPNPEVAGFVSHDLTSTTVFRASPYSPLRNFPGLTHPLVAFDTNGDGLDELYGTRQNGSDFIRVSAQNGSVQTLLGMIPVPAPPSLGRLQGGWTTLAALASIQASLFQAGRFIVFDVDTAQTHYSAAYTRAPWWPAAFVRPQAAGPLHAASLVGRFPQGIQQYQVDLQLRDAVTGEPGAMRANVFPQGSSSEGATLMAGGIDGVPGDEIVLVRFGSNSAAAALIDGTTLQDRWRVSGPQTPLDSVRVRGQALVDRNQDGVRDIVLATSNGFGNGVRLLVLSGADGTLLWQSVTIPDSNTTLRVGLVAGEIDSQVGSEIVLAAESGLYAFDAQSGLTTWIVKSAFQERFSDVVHWGSGSGCRIGVVVQEQTLRVLSCADRQPIETLALPAGVERVAPLDPNGQRLGAVVAGDLWVSRTGGAFQLELPDLGAGLNLNWPWAVDSSPDGNSLLLGSSLQLVRALLDDAVFASDFEIVP